MKKVNIFLPGYDGRWVARFTKYEFFTTADKRLAGKYTEEEADKKMANFKGNSKANNYKLLAVKLNEALDKPIGGALGPGAEMPTLYDIADKRLQIDPYGLPYVEVLHSNGKTQRVYLKADITIY